LVAGLAGTPQIDVVLPCIALLLVLAAHTCAPGGVPVWVNREWARPPIDPFGRPSDGTLACHQMDLLKSLAQTVASSK
jgi:hypothetical protein